MHHNIRERRGRWICQSQSYCFTVKICAQQGVFRSLTVTFEPLSDEPKQHLSTVVAEGRSSVRVHIERVRPNLEIFKGGCS